MGLIQFAWGPSKRRSDTSYVMMEAEAGPRAAGRHQGWRRWGRVPRSAHRGGAGQHLGLRILVSGPRDNTLLCFKPPSSWCSATAAAGNEHSHLHHVI